MTPEEFATLDYTKAEKAFANLCKNSINFLAVEKLFLTSKSNKCFNGNILLAGAMTSISNGHQNIFEKIIKFSEQQYFKFHYEHAQAIYNITASAFDENPTFLMSQTLDYIDEKYNIVSTDLTEETYIYKFRDDGSLFVPAGSSAYSIENFWEEYDGNVLLHAVKNNLPHLLEKLLNSKIHIPDSLLRDTFLIACENMHKPVIATILQYPNLFERINNDKNITAFLADHAFLSTTAIENKKDIQYILNTISFKNELETDLDNNQCSVKRAKI